MNRTSTAWKALLLAMAHLGLLAATVLRAAATAADVLRDAVGAAVRVDDVARAAAAGAVVPAAVVEAEAGSKRYFDCEKRRPRGKARPFSWR